MGQQQFIVLVLCIILVGIAIATGVRMTLVQAKQSNLEAIINDLNNLGGLAYQYMIRPSSMQGSGGTAFSGFEQYFSLLPEKLKDNENGVYSVVSESSTRIIIKGISKSFPVDPPSGNVRWISVDLNGGMIVYNEEPT
jgi:hypothetical protein